MADYPELHKINILVKLQTGVTDTETRWIKDTPFKISACYLASKLTDYHAREIAAFFDINRKYMVLSVESYAIGLLMDPEAKEFMELAERCFRELELIHA